MTVETDDGHLDGYEDYRGALTPYEQRQLVWSAHSAGYMFRIMFGPDADPVSEHAKAELMRELGEDGPLTDVNSAWRERLLRSYAGGVNYWRKLAGDALVTP